MGRRGRYGKYGESKRLDRLREFKALPLRSDRMDPKTTRSTVQGAGISDERRFRIIPARSSDVNYIRNLSKKVFNQYGPYDDTLVGWFISGMAFTLLALIITPAP